MSFKGILSVIKGVTHDDDDDRAVDDVVQEFWFHCGQVNGAVQASPNPELVDRIQTAQSGAFACPFFVFTRF